MGIETALLAATIGSGVMGAYGSIKQGQASQSAAESQSNALVAQSEQERRRAGQERAMAQRTAEEKDWQAKELESKQRAVAAASGGGTGGSAAAIIGRTAAEGQFQSDLELSKGEERAKGMEYQSVLDMGAAADKREQGKAARKASYWQAGSQVLGAVGSAASVKAKSGSTSGSGVYY